MCITAAQTASPTASPIRLARSRFARFRASWGAGVSLQGFQFKPLGSASGGSRVVSGLERAAQHQVGKQGPLQMRVLLLDGAHPLRLFTAAAVKRRRAHTHGAQRRALSASRTWSSDGFLLPITRVVSMIVHLCLTVLNRADLRRASVHL